MKKNKVIKTQEEIQEEQLNNRIEDIRRYHVKNTPTVSFDIGERVGIGALDSTIISDILDNGQIYVVDVIRKDRDSVHEYKSAWSWTEIEKYKENYDDVEIFSKNDDFRLNYSQRNLSAILTNYYNFGVDMEPEYQRELVWTNEDKVALIDSIFQNVDIGKFLFVHLEWNDREDHKSYEILDGKQRVTAITEFYENRFTYKGKYYKDLHPKDKNHFENYNISYAEVKNITQKQKYEYFLKVNTCGKIVSQEHLDYVKTLLDNA